MNGPLAYFLHWEQVAPNDIALRQPFGRTWKTWTWRTAGGEIRKIAGYLESLALPPHSHIAILSKNCAEWIMADLAIMMTGHVSVPVYATLPAEAIRQVLEHSEARVVFIGKLDHYASQKEGIPESIKKIGMGVYGIRDGMLWEEIVEGQAPMANPATLGPNDVLTIIYTSGTTGRPKGVIHTMGSFDTTVKTSYRAVQFPMRARVMSYLPLSHIAERLGIEFVGLYVGAQFSFAESLDSFAQNLLDTQPHYFIAVPRIWAKFQEKILEKIPQKKLRLLLSIPLVSGLVKRKIRRGMGFGETSLFISGAAPLSVSILNWFHRLGITIYQVLGMTEDCVYAHFNRPGANKFGTVGKPMDGLKVKLSGEGELLVKSDCLMKGYFKEPELTASMFDEEGYLKTGDTGVIDSEGFLTIVGRIKDQFKTDKGKYVSPAPIELELLQNPDIEQVCVVGMGVPQPIALTVLSGLGKTKSKAALTESLQASILKVNGPLEPHEKVNAVVILQEEWTVENGLMTPSLKLKRNEIEKRHLPNYPKWYHQNEMVVWA